MGSAVTKTEMYKQMEEDVKILKQGIENIKKIQEMVGGIQSTATSSLESFSQIKNDVNLKVETTTKQITDLGNL